MISVVQYNLLSPSLGNPSYYINTNPEHLQKNQRQKRIFDKLQRYVTKNSVICLQEVTVEWQYDLYQFFKKQGYQYFYNNYGNKFNGFMGIGIAVPSFAQVFKIEGRHIGSSFRYPPDKPISKIRLWFEKLKAFVYGCFGKTTQFMKEEEVQQQALDAKTRNNMLLQISLGISGTKVVIANYHMPCAYNNPLIMKIHTYSACETVQKFVQYQKANYTVFCGDFNFDRDSEYYQFMTTGKMNPHPNFDFDFNLGLTWKDVVCLSNQIQNALSISNKKLYTCWTNNKGGEYQGHLDHIFASHNVNCVDSNIEGLLTNQTHMPNQLEPSDHLLLNCILGLG